MSGIGTEALQKAFDASMTEFIQKMMRKAPYDKKAAVDVWTKRTAEAAQAKMLGVDKDNYRYVTDVLVMQKGDPHTFNRKTRFWWKQQTDHEHRVQVTTVGGVIFVVVVYCVNK